MATKEKEEAETEREGAPDGPLLDLSDDYRDGFVDSPQRRRQLLRARYHDRIAGTHASHLAALAG